MGGGGGGGGEGGGGGGVSEGGAGERIEEEERERKLKDEKNLPLLSSNLDHRAVLEVIPRKVGHPRDKEEGQENDHADDDGHRGAEAAAVAVAVARTGRSGRRWRRWRIFHASRALVVDSLALLLALLARTCAWCCAKVATVSRVWGGGVPMGACEPCICQFLSTGELPLATVAPRSHDHTDHTTHRVVPLIPRTLKTHTPQPSHCVSLMAPSIGPNRPALQGVHTSCSITSANLPLGQGEQPGLLLPNVPAAHFVH